MLSGALRLFAIAAWRHRAGKFEIRGEVWRKGAVDGEGSGNRGCCEPGVVRVPVNIFHERPTGCGSSMLFFEGTVSEFEFILRWVPSAGHKYLDFCRKRLTASVRFLDLSGAGRPRCCEWTSAGGDLITCCPREGPVVRALAYFYARSPSRRNHLGNGRAICLLVVPSSGRQSISMVVAPALLYLAPRVYKKVRLRVSMWHGTYW